MRLSVPSLAILFVCKLYSATATTVNGLAWELLQILQVRELWESRDDQIWENSRQFQHKKKRNNIYV